ncbi:MAG TPA: type VI secretion system baseplate subunit TssE [Steroidobacteraceae bacterium]|nr:type VI secretion system baseplate subunit TssE [Steroidobacteraceae bacterium]
MAELSLRERLQPSLLDRLVDDERMLTLFEVCVTAADLARLAISERELAEILGAQGLRMDEGAAARQANGAGEITLRLTAASGRVSLAQLKAFVVKPPGAPQGVALQGFCRIDARNVLNDTAEAADRRHLSSRRLREYVCRDIAALLNSMNLETADDLTPYPHVQRSVLNYGMPSLAGRSATSIDALKTAATIEEVIRRFEPRLAKVRVAPDTERHETDGHQLAFRIEAELWGQPAPQQLLLRTSISTESGDVTVADAGAR